MFPEETHVNIVKRLDEIEAEAFTQYRRLARERLRLMRQWRVMPDGSRWSEEKQSAAENEVR